MYGPVPPITTAVNVSYCAWSRIAFDGTTFEAVNARFAVTVFVITTFTGLLVPTSIAFTII